MTEEITLCDLNLEDSVVVEYIHDGETFRVNRLTLWIGNFPVQMPQALYRHIYNLCDERAADLDL